jgi:hypothetical protein
MLLVTRLFISGSKEGKGSKQAFGMLVMNELVGAESSAIHGSMVPRAKNMHAIAPSTFFCRKERWGGGEVGPISG